MGQLTPGATTLGDCRSEPLDTVRMETVKSNLHTPKVASPIHGINYYLTKGRALAQIRERGYADKYRRPGVPVHLIGIEFGREKRNIVGFEFETV